MSQQRPLCCLRRGLNNENFFRSFRSLAGGYFGGGRLVNAWAYFGEAHVDRKQLNGFPEQMGEWLQEQTRQIIDDGR